uniref:DUF1211 domain-containing protein n=1 Tax=Acidobacterium capsulatum TaxID=33075 RepID=A0A7V5CUB8_9BACT
MPTLYNRIANQSLERLAALSDGIFAVAMTLLVLDLHLPASEAIHSEHGLQAALWMLAPQLLVYLMSFMTLGIFWNGQQTQFHFFERSDRDLSWLHLGFLFTITVMPFTTQLLAHFLAYRTALVVYWFNILLPGLLLYASWRYATRAGLLKAEVPLEIRRAVRRRVVVAQSLYALGALLCVLGTRWSIGFILLVQMNYAVTPRLPGRSKKV